MDEENQANTLVSVAPLPQEPLDKPTVRESPPENGANPSHTTNGHSNSGTPVADTEMWITFSPPLPWHIHTGPSPCRHLCCCRGHLHLLLKNDLACLHRPDNYDHLVLGYPIFLQSSLGSKTGLLEYPGFWNQDMMFTFINKKSDQNWDTQVHVNALHDISEAHDDITLTAMPVMWNGEDAPSG